MFTKTSDYRLMLDLLRVSGEGGVATRSGAYVSSPSFSPSRFLSLCRCHGVAPAVFAKCARAGLPQGVALRLSDVFVRYVAVEWLPRLHLLCAAEKAYQTSLTAAGIEFIPFRGLSLARRYYDDLAHRHTSDCDVLISESSLAQACEALQSSAFVEVHDCAYGALAREHLGQVELKHTHTGVVLDIHTRVHFSAVVGPSAAPSFSFEYCWANSEMIHDVRYLRPELELVLLCLHNTYNHGFDKHARALADAALIYARQPDLFDKPILMEALQKYPLPLGAVLTAALPKTVLPTQSTAFYASAIERLALPAVTFSTRIQSLPLHVLWIRAWRLLFTIPALPRFGDVFVVWRAAMLPTYFEQVLYLEHFFENRPKRHIRLVYNCMAAILLPCLLLGSLIWPLVFSGEKFARTWARKAL